MNENDVEQITEFVQKNTNNEHNSTLQKEFINYFLRNASMDSDNRKCTVEIQYTIPLQQRVKLYSIYQQKKPDLWTFEAWLRNYVEKKIKDILPDKIDEEYNTFKGDQKG